MNKMHMRCANGLWRWNTSFKVKVRALIWCLLCYYAVCKLLYKNFSASRNWHRHGLFCMLHPICWHSSTTFFFFLTPLQEADITYPPIFFSIITQKKTSSGARVLLCLAEEWWELSHGQRGFSSLPKSTQVFHTYFVIIQR